MDFSHYYRSHQLIIAIPLIDYPNLHRLPTTLLQFIYHFRQITPILCVISTQMPPRRSSLQNRVHRPQHHYPLFLRRPRLPSRHSRHSCRARILAAARRIGWLKVDFALNSLLHYSSPLSTHQIPSQFAPRNFLYFTKLHRFVNLCFDH